MPNSHSEIYGLVCNHFFIELFLYTNHGIYQCQTEMFDNGENIRVTLRFGVL
jgi:hypothetical protein